MEVRTIIESAKKDVDSTVEYQVKVRNDRVYLDSNGNEFLVPEQASRQILLPVLEELKNGAF